MFYTYTRMFSYAMLFSISRRSRLEIFIVYSIRSLSMLYTHFLISLILKLGIVVAATAPAPPDCGGLS